MRYPLLTASLFVAFSFVAPLGATDSAASLAWRHFSARSQAALAHDNAAPLVLGSATASEPAASLAFSDFFGPIGDRGLDYSDTLRALAGRRIRISGYMVREPVRSPGLFMLTARPVTIEKSGYCFHEDLPPSTVHVIDPSAAARPLPYRPGRLELVGTLELGPRPEADGRNSIVRLVLDSAASAAPAVASSTSSSTKIP